MEAGGLTLVVWQTGRGTSWNMDFSSIRPFVDRVLLAEYGAGGHLFAPLHRSFPGIAVEHLRFTDSSAESRTRELGCAIGDEARWVLPLQAGANAFAARNFQLPTNAIPWSAIRIYSGGRLARWAPTLSPGGGRFMRVGDDGEVFVDFRFDNTSCTDALTVDMHRSAATAAATSARDLETALEHARATDTPTQRLEVAERHFDLSRYNDATFWYRRCLDGLAEPGQRWTAHYHLAICLKAAGQPWPVVEQALAEAFDLNPHRAEPLFHIADHYRRAGDLDKAHDLAGLGLEIEPPRTPDPFEFSVYQYELPLLYIACAAELGKDRNCVQAANQLLRKPGVPDGVRGEAAGYRARSIHKTKPVYPLRIRRKNRIVVVAPFRNAGAFLEQCVSSLASQEYEHCRIVLIDDASTDGAPDRLTLPDERFVFERNDSRRGMLRNQITAVERHAEPGDIVVYVDGDDRLTEPGVLAYINDFFNATRCWIMYGQYRRSNGRYGTCEPVTTPPDGDILDAIGDMHFPMHIRAHRAGLIYHLLRIDPELTQLQDEDGGLLDSIADMALMRMLMQLAGLENIRYNERVLYEYNVRNPESHYSAFALKRLQNRQSHILRTKPRLDPLPSYMPGAVRERSRAGRTAALFIALDGVNPDLVCHWGAAGLLPNLERLSGNGWRRDIDAPDGLGDDVFWISLATGALPDELGYYFRIHWNPATYVCKLYDPARNLPRQPFWSELSEQDPEVAVIDYPETRRAGPINGFEVAEWMTHARIAAPRFFPAALEDDWTSRFGTDPLNGCTETLSKRTNNETSALLDELLHSVERKTDAALHYLDRGGWDFFAVSYSQGHDVGHQFWHLHDPAHPAHQPAWLERYGDPLLRAYQCLDEAVGRLLERAGEDAAVIQVTGLAMQTKASCNPVLDEMLWHIERPGRGYPPDAAQPEQRKRRRFFAVPNNNLSGAVRINVQGRESVGLVAPGVEYDETLDWIERGLRQFVNTDTGEPVVADFIRTRAVYDGPRAHALPDVLVSWNRSAPIERIASPSSGDIRIRPRDVVDTRSGDHFCKAELVTSFEPPFTHEQRVPVQDIAPWIKEIILARSAR